MPTTMLISEDQLRRAVELLRSYGARKVLLFGSSVHAPDRARDLDLAVEGIPLGRILDASAGLMDILDIPFDLVSREENPDFFKIIHKRAKVLYDQDAA